MLALAAAQQAWSASGLETFPSERVGLILGTARGPAGQWLEAARAAPGRALRPSLAASTTLASLSGVLSLRFHLRGACHVVSASCVSGALAMAAAAQELLLGNLDAVLAGGVEAPCYAEVLGPMRSAHLLASHAEAAKACRPFDRDRNGMVPGEGSAFLALERGESARRRGAPILARLAGWATTADGRARTAGDPEGAGLRRAIEQALQRAQLGVDAIDYVNAHGTGTRLNDRLEVAALRRIFGDRLARLPCSSTKPITGHCLGASPAIEAVICVTALEQQVVPPTANCHDLAPDCAPLDPVAEGPRAGCLRSVLSVSQGFWGNNAALVFCPPR